MYAKYIPGSKVKRSLIWSEWHRFNVIRYGLNNLYPNETTEIVKNSGIGSIAVQRLCDFVLGQGFEDESIGDVVVSMRDFHEFTLNKLVQKISKDFIIHGYPCMHVQYNGMLEIESVSYCNFDQVRISVETDSPPKGMPKGKRFLAVWNNWEYYENYRHHGEPKYYNGFDPRPEVVARQIEEAGGIDNYNGQIYYPPLWDGGYSVSRVHSVRDDMETDNNVSHSKNKISRNDFVPGQILKYPGLLQEQDRINLESQLSDFSAGSGENPGGVLLIEDPNLIDGNKGPMLEKIEAQDVSERYQHTEQSSHMNIARKIGILPILIGLNESGSLGDKNYIEQAYAYQNKLTTKMRADFSDHLKTVFSYFKDPIENFDIIPLDPQLTGLEDEQ